jgi:hypothetical protein
MALIPLKIPAGVYRVGTDYEGSGRWYDTNLVRWQQGSLRPVGGWQQKFDISSLITSVPRGMHSWIDNGTASRVAVATSDEVFSIDATGKAYNLTPNGLTKGAVSAAVNTGYGGSFYSYGGSLYGRPQPSTGVFQEADSWSLDNWGEYLAGCLTSDGQLYEWDLGGYGSELLTDGDFATGGGAGWTVGANWTDTTGVGLYTRVVTTFDATDAAVVDIATDTITLTAHGLSDNDPLLYTVTAGQTPIGGLTSGTTYYVVNSTANTFELEASIGGGTITLTALGTGTTDTFEDLRHEALEQQIVGVANKNYEVVFTITAVGASPSVDVLVTGTTSATNYISQTLSAGTYTLYFDNVTDTAFDVSFKSTSATGDYFSIDDVSIKQRPEMTQMPNSPVGCKGLVVTEERFVFGLQADANPRKIAWCDREDNTTWAPAATNEAGDFELVTNGEIMQGVRIRGATLIVTTVDAHMATYQGPPFVYGFQRVGSACGCASRHAVVAVDTGAFWIGKEAFFMFDGSVAKQMPCDVQDYVFEDMNKNQITKVYGVQNSEYGEVWWFYPSANSNECDSYVVYDYQENHWHIGKINRTCGTDQGVFSDPIWADDTGVMYDQEMHGVAHGSYTPYAESGPISLGNGDTVMKVNQLIGDEATIGEVQVQFKTRFHPNDVSRTYPSTTTYYSLTNMPTSVRFTGRQVRLRVEATGSDDWRVGTMRVNAESGGRR